MAEKKNFTIENYNGTDYDTLYPQTNSGQVLLDTDAQYRAGLVSGDTLTDALTNFAKSELNVSVGGAMSLLMHLGGTSQWSNTINAGAFQNSYGFTYENGLVWRDDKIGKYSNAVLQSNSVIGNPGSADTNAYYHVTNLNVRWLATKQEWLKLFDFYPDSFGQLTRLDWTFETSVTCNFKLGIWDSETDEKVVETASQQVTSGKTSNFAVDYMLDPNKRYSMKLYMNSLTQSTMGMSSLKLNIGTQTYSNGSVIIPLDNTIGAKKVVILARVSSIDDVSCQVQLDDGNYTTATLVKTGDDMLLSGDSCQFVRYEADVTNNTQNVNAKITTSNVNSMIYDYALILI